MQSIHLKDSSSQKVNSFILNAAHPLNSIFECVYIEFVCGCVVNATTDTYEYLWALFIFPWIELMLRTFSMDLGYFFCSSVWCNFICHIFARKKTHFLAGKILETREKWNKKHFLDVVKRAYILSRRMKLCCGLHVFFFAPVIAVVIVHVLSLSVRCYFASAFFNRILTRFHQQLQRYCFHVNIMQCNKIVCLHAHCTKHR